MVDVAVIGCGTGGPAAALFLSRAGHHVELFERVPELTSVGAGLLIQPTGQLVMHRLGLLDELLESAHPVGALRAQTRRGKVFCDLSYGELGAGVTGLGVHRATLLAVLIGAMRREEIPLRLGTPVDHLERDGDRHWVLDSGGGRHGPYDLVVLADGARSKLREDLGFVKRARRYPWGAIWVIEEDPEGRFDSALLQVVEGTDRMTGFLPTGREASRPHPLVSMFWGIENAAAERLYDAGLEAFKADALRLYPACAPILEQVHGVDELTHGVYHDVVLRRLHDQGLVVVGDSGHAMSPHLGQGANMALFDAMVLADQIEMQDNLQDALARYSRARGHHLRFYQWATRLATPFFQSHLQPLALVRDQGFGLLSLTRATRRQMLLAMAGLKRGLLRRSFPLPQLPHHR